MRPVTHGLFADIRLSGVGSFDMRTLAIGCLMLLGCGGAAAEPAVSDEAGGEATEPVAASIDPTDPPVGASPACAGYLAHYRRCEGALAGEIAAGDRRSYDAEASWVHFMESSAEGPGMPASCASMDHDLAASCP